MIRITSKKKKPKTITGTKMLDSGKISFFNLHVRFYDLVLRKSDKYLGQKCLIRHISHHSLSLTF